MSMNKILIIGNLGGDPEMRYVPSGQAVTSFSVATNRRYTTADGERHDETEWFRISAWGRLAETCNQFLTKGRQVYVEGRLSSRTYETRDGQTRFVNEITANDVRFLGQGSGGESQGQPSGGEFQSQEGEETGTGGTEPDDLPF
jgi:single-strand DNA-binding protein